MKLVIIAGGKGKRLGLKDIPKPMVRIGGKPVLEHQINLAKKYGIKNIHILSGYLANVIKDYFDDGSAFGVNITHIVEDRALGTAGAVKQLAGRLKKRFMVFYGDIMLNIDLKSFINFDNKADSIATVIVHPNDHPYDSDLLEINENNIVTAFHPKPHNENTYYRNLVNASVYILDPEIFKYIPHDMPSDFGRDIFPSVLQSNKTIRAHKTAEYIKDMGTADRFKKASRDFLSGKVRRLSKKYKRAAIFMDRDGTLVKDVDLLSRAEDLELFSFSAPAIKKINDFDFLSILITNQPVVARNLCDLSTIRVIHNKLETLLGRERAYLDDIYFCPHHPHKGYPEENPLFKIACNCRKPATGMIEQAVNEYNIDIESSWIIGDSTTDIQTGINAGLRTIMVRTGEGGKDGKFQCSPDFAFDNLESAVDFVLKDGQQRSKTNL
ncbi:MAG: D,D-heptose 1,7-bisphosphate phosphatase [Odoribacter sp.]|nr:D,D-heptose 1,7-bisphosphate phosphatase [Odoribacter sp.]